MSEKVELEPEAAAGRKGRPLRRRVLFGALAVLLSLGMTELFLHVLHFAFFGEGFSFRACHAAMLSIGTEAGGVNRAPGDGEGTRYMADRQAVEVVHPYLGWVVDPRRTTNTSELGFHDPGEDVLAGSPEGTLTVCLFGGSFARQLSTVGRASLERELGKAGRPVRLVSMAMGAYKQPQQVIALSYVLSLGARFDVVINVDGYNEASLGLSVNGLTGTSALYPTGWYYRMMNVADQETLRRVGKVEVLYDWRAQWARVMGAVPGSYSILRCGLWQGVDGMFYRSIQRERVRGVSPRVRGKSYLLTGPDLVSGEAEEALPVLAGHWAECSRQMDALTRAQGGLYFHFLQPNQYDEGSKVLTEQERREAYSEDEPSTVTVRLGYPMMRERGAELAAEGVRFVDLSMIFRDHEGTVYHDVCCHLNQEGYEIITRRIGEEVVRALGETAQRAAGE